MSQRIIRAGEGEVLGSIDGCRDRFLIDSKDWGGRFAGAAAQDLNAFRP